MKNIDEYVDFLSIRGNFKKTLVWNLIVTGANFLLWNSLIWLLILSRGKTDAEYIKKAINTAFVIFILIVITRYLSSTLNMLSLMKIEKEHQSFLTFVLKNIPKDKLLELDMTDITIKSRLIIDMLPFWISRKLIYVNAFGRLVSIYIAIKKLNVGLILGLLAAVQLLFYFWNKRVIKETQIKINDNNKVDLFIRRQIENSKIKIINNTFNQHHFDELTQKYRRNYQYIEESKTNMNFYSDLSVIIVTAIVVFVKYKDEDIYSKILYFFVIRDINGLFDIVLEIYRLKPKMELVNIGVRAIEELYKLIEHKKCDNTTSCNDKILSFDIVKFITDNPKINIQLPTRFKAGTPTLIDGKSGTGKTTLFKALKKIGHYDIETVPTSLEDKIYFCSQSSKPYESPTVESFITNSSSYPDKEIVKKCMSAARIEHRFDMDMDIPLEMNKISGGEGTRLAIASIMYEIMKNDYDIIILDEMDANLDTEIAMEIFKNIIDMLKDKILLVTIHNDSLKTLFTNRIVLSK
jgi:ABC-type transport system involved in cytochrome bd biosynthesis fused ATPase/permease subunit